MYNPTCRFKKLRIAGGVELARRTREESLETKNKLLESALEVMTDKPYSQVTMNEIAERVGLSKGAAYWHFKNKHEILIELIVMLCEESGGDPRLLEGDSDSFRKIRRYYISRINRQKQSARYGRINILFQRRLEWPKEVHDKVYQDLMQRIREEQRMVEMALCEGQENGQVRRDVSSREISSLIAAVFFGIFALFGPNPLYPGGEFDLEKCADFIFDAFGKELKAIQA